MSKFNDVMIDALKRRTGGKLTNDLIANALMERSELIDTLIDPRRDIDAECHYPTTGEITADQLKNMYDRDPIACRVVQCLARQSWQVQPSVYESEDPEVKTPFEEAWDALQPMTNGKSWFKTEEAGTVWEYLMRADILSGIGHFGVLLMGFDDGKSLQEPVDGAMVVNDCYLTKTEEDNLHKLPDINDQEKLALNQLARQREFVLNYMQAQEDKKYQQQEKQQQGTALFGDATGATTTEEGNQQYSQGFGLKGEAEYKPSPIGTDQQYFGVQFGPSEQPSDQPSKRQLKLLFLRPFDESLVQIVRYEWNINNPRFGMPVMYRITLNDPREQHSGIGLPMATVFVHWSRVIHLADNLNSSEIFGTPRCRPVFNRLLDLQKIYGASAEGYWQAAFTGLALETHPQLGGDVTIDSDDVRDQIENYINSLQRYLALTGMSAHTLAPQVSDPSSQIDKHLEAICIQLEIPKRVFMGSERGELASSQDDASWNDRLKARQQGYITPRIIVPFIDRLISVGVLPEPDYVEPIEEPEIEDEFDDMGDDVQYAPMEEEADLEQGNWDRIEEDESAERLNGAQIDAALNLMFRVSEGEIAPEAAVELLISLGIKRERADRMINSQSIIKKVITSDNPEITLQKIDAQVQKKELPIEEEEDRSPAGLIKNTSTRLPLGAKWLKGRVGEIYQYNGKIFKVKNLVSNAAIEELDEEESIEDGVPVDGDDLMEEDMVEGGVLEDNPLDTVEQIGVKAAKGYCVVWPDLESNTDLSKAQIASTKTQAMATYVSGNVESIMPLIHFYTKILGLTDEEAADLVEAAEEQEADMEQEQLEKQMNKPFGGGQPGIPGQQPNVPGQSPFGQEQGQPPLPEEEQGALADLNDKSEEVEKPQFPFDQT
jgi:hypothetical protein